MSDFLAVDTSSKYLTVLAKKGEKVVLRHTAECAMRHSVILMDEIDKALAESGLSPRDCHCFAAVTGPGSFTGIRIGLATIKGFCTALGARGVGVTSFDLIAYNVKSAKPFAVAIDAMHGKYYFCTYSAAGEPASPPAYVAGEDINRLALPVYGFEELPLANYTRLNAGDCLYSAVLAAEGKGGELSALYVRRSQAEEARRDS